MFIGGSSASLFEQGIKKAQKATLGLASAGAASKVPRSIEGPKCIAGLFSGQTGKLALEYLLRVHFQVIPLISLIFTLRALWSAT